MIVTTNRKKKEEKGTKNGRAVVCCNDVGPVCAPLNRTVIRLCECRDVCMCDMYSLGVSFSYIFIPEPRPPFIKAAAAAALLSRSMSTSTLTHAHTPSQVAPHIFVAAIHCLTHSHSLILSLNRSS